MGVEMSKEGCLLPPPPWSFQEQYLKNYILYKAFKIFFSKQNKA